MKNLVTLLTLGLLLAGFNAFAADGDLYVNGKVGIGTTSPAGSLDVNGSICIKGNCVNSIGGGIQTIKVQTFTSSGTYIPSAGLVYADVTVVGPGGWGGWNGGSPFDGGGGGGWAKGLFTAAQIGASQTITIAGGVGGSGGYTQFGAAPLLSATAGTRGDDGGVWPGAGGVGSSVNAYAYGGGGAGGPSGTTGGYGGSSIFGGGGAGGTMSSQATAGASYGAGGGGSAGYGASKGGMSGVVIVTEYCSQ